MRSTPSAVGSVLVNQREMNVAVVRAIVTRHEGEHEGATLFVNSATATVDFHSLPDQRIEFTFGGLGIQSTFQGYVNSVTPNRRFVGDTQITEQEIECMGASMVMKGNRPRFFTEMTATQMVAKICADNNLGFHDEFRNDNNQWRQLAQTSETDWQMLLTLADRISAKVVYERGVIRLINYLDVSYRQLPSRLYRTKNNMATTDHTDDNQGVVVEYVPTNVSVRDPSYRTPTMAYMSGRQAVMLQPPPASATSQPSGRGSRGADIVSRFATSYPALSQQEAEAMQSGFYTPPWNQEGSLRVTGDAAMMPGNIIQVASAGLGTTMQADYDGVWYVNGVSHSLGLQGRFYTTLSMGRPQARGTNWYAPRPFWLGEKRGMPLLTPAGNGSWVSNWRTP